MKTINLTQNKVAKISDEDFERVSFYKWNAAKSSGGKFYAVRKEWMYDLKDSLHVSLARFILQAPDNLFVDHINGDTLDNQRENLRLCTRAENARNRRLAKNNTSGCTGVVLANNKTSWKASVYINGKMKHLGTFKTKEEAVSARKRAEKEVYGNFAPNTGACR
jgi:hypothetical protein